MAAGKDRRVVIRLVSSALTGFFYTTTKVRTGPKLQLMKYDPKVRKRVLFIESARQRS